MTQPARGPVPNAGGRPTDAPTDQPPNDRPPADQALYGISVAAELTGCTPETLRLYERRNLLTPARTDGGTRRYTDDDIRRIRRIAELAATGINLTGVAHILTLETENTDLRDQLNRSDQPAAGGGIEQTRRGPT